MNHAIRISHGAVRSSSLRTTATRRLPLVWRGSGMQHRALTSITYSGGQASEGQGGFYGSGGARASLSPESGHRPEMLALAADVQRIQHTMKELVLLEDLLERESEESEGKVTGKSIEIRGSIKKLMTSPELIQCLDRLEVQGEPVWGLSSDERELITLAREKVNNC